MSKQYPAQFTKLVESLQEIHEENARNAGWLERNQQRQIFVKHFVD
jgi:hypothetical protein